MFAPNRFMGPATHCELEPGLTAGARAISRVQLAGGCRCLTLLRESSSDHFPIGLPF